MSKRLVTNGGAGRQSNGVDALRSAYRQANTWNGRFKAYEKLSRISNAGIRSFLARAALELSLTTDDHIAAGDLLNEAIEFNLQAEAGSVNRPSEAVKTSMFRHNLPLMLSVHSEHETPDKQRIEEAHSRLAVDLFDANSSLRTQKKSVTERVIQKEPGAAELRRLTDFYGDASEAFVLIALQRYATERAVDQNFTPIPSLLSEDIGGKRGSMVMNRWDVSVYNDDLESPAHKVQVKWNLLDQHRNSDRSYGSDISVVELKNGLSLSSHYPIKLGRLITEAAGHVIDNPPPRDAEFFARRQNVLLEQIGYEF